MTPEPNTTQPVAFERYERSEAISVGNMQRPRVESDPEGEGSVTLVSVMGKTVFVNPAYVEEFERRFKPQLKRGGGLKRVKHESRPEQDDDEEGPQAVAGSPARGAAATRTSERSMASRPSEVTNPLGNVTGGQD